MNSQTIDNQPVYLNSRAKRLAWGLFLGAFAFVFWFVLASGDAMAARSGYERGWDKAAVQRLIIREARANGVVPASLALAVARVESNFNHKAESKAGARGVMQIMPRTARTVFGVKANELWDPMINVRLGIDYLEQLYFQYGQRWPLALSHYNGGTLKGKGAAARPHGYTRIYVADVLGHQRDYQKSAIVAKLDDARDDLKRAVNNRQASLEDRQVDIDDTPLPYWAYERPAVDKDWRHYLEVADRALDRVKNGDQAPTENTGNLPDVSDDYRDGLIDELADDRIVEVEPRFRPRRPPPPRFGPPPLRSDELADRVNRTRDRFSRNLRESDGWRDYPG